MSNQDLRMDAYYYGFQKTGCPKIDLILSAVACAGKSFHRTEQWNEEAYTPLGHSGSTPVEWIQNAAMLAAAPVPPAGDVEVLGWRALGSNFNTEEFAVEYAKWAGEVNPVTELVDRTLVTRLAAERDEEAFWRKEAREGWGQATKVIEMQRSRLDEQEAELTKARFLVDQALHLQEEHYGDGMGLHLAMIKWARAAKPPPPSPTTSTRAAGKMQKRRRVVRDA